MDVTVIFCGKLSACPVRDADEYARRQETRTNTELCALSTVKPHGSMAALRSALRRFHLAGQQKHRRAPGVRRRFGYANRVPAAFSGIRLLKVKTRPGGQPDGSSYMGRLGWMGARAEYSRWGGITAPTHIVSRQDCRTFKTSGDFFGFRFGEDRRKSLPSRAIRGICGRFIRRHGRRGIIQRPAHRTVIAA